MNFKNKKEEYINQLRILQKNIIKEDIYTFSDNIIMYPWFSSQKQLYNEKIKKENKTEEDLNFIDDFEEILEEIEKIKKIENKRKLKEYEKHVNDYIKGINAINRFITKNEKGLINSKSLFNFYNSQTQYFEKHRNDENIDDFIVQKAFLFSKIDDRLFELENINYLKRVEEYLKIVSFINKKIDTNYFRFSDNKIMKCWYEKEEERIIQDRKKNIIPTKSRMDQIRAFAEIDNYLFDNEKSDFDTKADEYINKITDLERPLFSSDYIYFSDGKSMNKWYKDNIKEVIEKRKTKRLTKDEFHKVRTMAEIDNKIYDLRKGNK